MDVLDELPETPIACHRVKVKAPKSGSDRLELVLDDERDDDNYISSKNCYTVNNYNDYDECRQECPQDDENPCITDDKFPQSLYTNCTSSHSASTTETDNRAATRSSSSAGSSLRRTWSIESGDKTAAAISTDKYCEGGVEQDSSKGGGNVTFDDDIERKGSDLQINQTRDDHPTELPMDPILDQRMSDEIRDTCSQSDLVGADHNQSNLVDPTESIAFDGSIAAAKPIQVFPDTKRTDSQTSSTSAVKSKQLVKSGSVAMSEDSSVESMGWKVTNTTLKNKAVIPCSESTTGNSERSRNEIRQVLRPETRCSPGEGGKECASTTTNTKRHGTLAQCLSKNEHNFVNMTPHSTTSLTTGSMNHGSGQITYDNMQGVPYSELNARELEHEDEKFIEHSYRQSQHPHQYYQQRREIYGKRSTGSRPDMSSSQSIVTGRSDVAVCSTGVMNHHQRRQPHRQQYNRRQVRWQNYPNGSERWAACTEDANDHHPYPAIHHSQSNVSSRSAATSAYSNAALDGYIDPDEESHVRTGGEAFRMGAQIVSTARSYRRNIMTVVKKVMSRRKKSLPKEKTMMRYENHDYDLVPSRKQMRPPEIIQPTNNSLYKRDRSMSMPKSEYNVKDYDHLGNSLRVTSPRLSHGNEYNAPAAGYLSNISDEIRIEDNPWAENVPGNGLSIEQEGTGSYSNYNPGNDIKVMHEPSMFDSNNNELPIPSGEVNMASFGMPAFKWWTWKQKENIQDSHPKSSNRHGLDQDHDGDCTYFAFMCMLPAAEKRY